MPRGKSNTPIAKILISKELSRRGLAASFTRKDSNCDIIVTNKSGREVPVKVKAINDSSVNKWQFSDITKYCEITVSITKEQIVGNLKPCPLVGLIMILVIIDEGNHKFFILECERFQKLLVGHYKDYLAKHGGRRPRNPESLHCAINEILLRPFIEKWDTIEN